MIRASVRDLLTLSLAAVVLAACGIGPPAPATARLVVFGDSNVDNGNMFRLSGGTNPGPPNWRGRNSNGPVLVEYLAQSLGVPLEDHAVSGATTGRFNMSIWVAPEVSTIAPTGVLSQLDEFEQGGGRLGPRDIVVVCAASNDLFGANRQDTAEWNRRIRAARANLEAAVERLRSLGARRIVLINRLPRASGAFEDDADINAAVSTVVAGFAQPGMRIQLFDAHASVRRMMADPPGFGFIDANAECLATRECVSERYEEGLRVADKYIHFDGAHKTTRVHRLLADELAAVLR